MAISKPPKINPADEDALFQKYISGAPDGSPKTAKPETPATPEPSKKKPRESRKPEAAPEPARQPEQRKKKDRGKKEPITLTIAPQLLDKVNAAARESGMSRAAYIAMALSYAVNHGIFK